MTVVELAVALAGPVASTGLAVRARRLGVQRRAVGIGHGPVSGANRGKRLVVGRTGSGSRTRALRVTGGVTAGVVVLVAGLGWVGLVLAGAAGVALGIRSRHRRRIAAHEARLGALVALADRIASELRAGAGLAEALAGATPTAGPLTPSLQRVQGRCRIGRTLSGALAAWVEEEPSETGRQLARALALLAAEGGPATAALEGVAEGLRDEVAVADELRAQSAQARASALVVAAAPVGYLAFGALVDPSSLRLLTGTGTGRACLAAGLVLQVVGWAWIRRILRSAPR